MARPLPNTNAPASAKYQPIRHSVSLVAGPARPATSPGGSSTSPRAALGRRANGLARTTSASAPAPTNTQTISDSVQAVTSAATANRLQSSTSRPRVSRVNFTALRAMMAMTAAPMP